MSLKKAAGVLDPLLPRDYLQIYTDFYMPDDSINISKHAAAKREILEKLSELEKRIEAEGLVTKLKGLAATEKLAASTIDELRTLNPVEFLKAAADKGILLSPDNFFSYLFADRVKTADISGAKVHLKSIFSLLEKDAGDVVNDESFDIPVRSVAHNNTTINKLASEFSMFRPYVEARIGKQVKTAEFDTNQAPSPLAKELAKQYVNYKLAALNYLSVNNKLNYDFLITTVLQNNQ
jgi:hypothetical protein